MAEKRQFEDPLMSGTVITRLKKIYDRPNNVRIFNIEIILKTNDYVTVINTCYFPFFYIACQYEYLEIYLAKRKRHNYKNLNVSNRF